MTHFRLYKERLAQVEDKLEEVRAGKAGEYLNPLTELQENMKIRTQVAGNVLIVLSFHNWIYETRKISSRVLPNITKAMLERTSCFTLHILIGVLKELKIQNIKNKFEAEEQAAHQNYEVQYYSFCKGNLLSRDFCITGKLYDILWEFMFIDTPI